jgi:broad specificity phosphatase PhoE
VTARDQQADSPRVPAATAGAGIEKIVLIRHGVSTANLDPTIYLRQPDHTIPLANVEADATCLRAGELLRGLAIAPSAIRVWHSPYLRCQQTRDLVLQKAYPDVSLASRESFLLREQEFGDWDGLSEDEIASRDKERFERKRRLADAYGRFYFRYPHGESRADVVERITLFMGKLHRSEHTAHLIFLHGVTQRAFRMAWFNREVDWFETEPNPDNGSVLLIERTEAGYGTPSSDKPRWREHYVR